MIRIFFLICFFITSYTNAEENVILARYGENLITNADFERILSYYDATQRKAIESNPQLKLAILKQVVTNNLVFKIAEEKGFTKKENIKEQIKLMTEHFITAQFLKSEIVKDVSPQDKELKDYYALHLSDFVETQEQVRARHILLRTLDNMKEEEKKKVLEKAKDIIRLLKERADFAEMAKIHSDDPVTKAKGGDLGYFSRGKMVKAFEDVAFTLKVGEISEPIITKYGVHIIKVEDKKETKYKDFEKVKDDVRKRYIEEKQRQMVLNFLDELFKSKKVNINESYFLKKTNGN
jgi:parvulin-like peptidyl-prolyl isomerase